MEFKLPDMTCSHGASAVTRICLLIDPDAVVDIDLASRTLRIASTEDWREFSATLAEAGYTPA